MYVARVAIIINIPCVLVAANSETSSISSLEQSYKWMALSKH